MATEKQLNIAVIGSGLAGLTAAYLLEKNNNQHQSINVHLFEKNSSLGMDAASISVGSKKKFRIDVPMRSFMSGYYSHLFKLYKHLEIPAKEAKFDFGWYRIKKYHTYKQQQQQQQQQQQEDELDRERNRNESYLVYSGARTVGHFDLISTSIRSSTTTVAMFTLLLDIFRYIWQSVLVAYSYVWLMCISLWMQYRGHLENPEHPICNMTLGQFFVKYHIHPYFAHQVFVPLFAAVCTNTYQSMLDYPASEILEYMAMGLNQESYVCAGGVQQVVRTISACLRHIHLDTEIIAIRPHLDPHQHRYQLIDQYNNNYDIDHIIFATQGNQSVRILQDYVSTLRQLPNCQQSQEAIEAASEQIEVLGSFVYNTALVINHTDTRVLPSNPSHWKALNLAMVDKSVKTQQMDKNLIVPFPHDTTMATHILNYTHASNSKASLLKEVIKEEFNNEELLFLQTTNPCVAVNPNKVLSVAWFERATVTLKSKKALQKLFTFTAKPSTAKGQQQQQQQQQQQDKVELGDCQGKQGIWFVGSYCWKGIPLLEGCVASAEYVVTKGLAKAEQLDIHVPWLLEEHEQTAVSLSNAKKTD